MKAPKLIEWIQHYIQMGWVDVTELMEIELELLDHFGPSNLGRVIKAAESLKKDYDDTEMFHKRQADFYFNKIRHKWPDEKPKRTDDYLVNLPGRKNGEMAVMYYSVEWGEWGFRDCRRNENDARKIKRNIT